MYAVPPPTLMSYDVLVIMVDRRMETPNALDEINKAPLQYLTKHFFFLSVRGCGIGRVRGCEMRQVLYNVP